MNRLINLFRRRRLNAEIDEELQFHVEARVRDNIAAGMTTEKARRDAMRRFGGLLLAREGSRDADMVVWIETIAQDVRYALRGLRKNPGVTSIALLSLGLAIGANTAIFSIVNGVLLRALPYKDSGRIAMLWTTNRLNGAMEQNASLLNMDDWKARNHSFEDMAAYRESDGTLSIDDASEEAEWSTYAWVTGNFFELLGRTPVLGRVFDEQEFASRSGVVVLSRRFWQRRFHSSPQAIGRVINLAGLDLTVIGVMPEDFWFPSREVEFWVPVSLHFQWLRYRADRHWRVGAVFGRLRQHTTLQRAQWEMRGIAAHLEREYPDANTDQGINVVPLQIQVNGKSIPFMLAILFGAVIFVLLIACANVANLLLARGIVRGREIALRAALGAGRGRIARQVLTESVLLSCAAGVLGLPIAAWSMRALIAIAPSNIARLDEVRMDGTVLLFTFCLSLLCGVLFGLTPTIQMSGRAPAGSLHWSNRNRTGGRSAWMVRSAFVVCQFALALVLLAGAGLLLRSLAAVQSVDSGFGDRDVLTAYLRFSNALPPVRRATLYQQALERVGQLPGVRAAGAISTMFWGGDDGKFGLRAVEGRAAEPRERWSPLTWSTVSGNYFEALGVPLLRGRFFRDRDRQDSPPVVLVNETMARRYWPGEDAVGKRIKGFDARGRDDEWVTVIGVVKDVHSRGLERAPMAQIFESQSQSLDETENLVVSAGSSRIADAVRNSIHELDRTAVVSDFSTVSQTLHEQGAQRRFQTFLLSTFAALALILAGAGICGMMHYSVAQRTQEIGIRMALGARRSNVLTMVLSEGAALAAAGVGLGIAGSLVLLRAISSLLFGVTPQDPLTFGLVSLTLTTVAVAGCYVPARRATRVDPMAALRCE